jgi:hypothetical protein
MTAPDPLDLMRLLTGTKCLRRCAAATLVSQINEGRA